MVDKQEEWGEIISAVNESLLATEKAQICQLPEAAECLCCRWSNLLGGLVPLAKHTGSTKRRIMNVMRIGLGASGIEYPLYAHGYQAGWGISLATGYGRPFGN